MGLLIKGVWRDQWYDTGATGGRFIRETSQFRHWITPDGAPGPDGQGGFRAEAGRYHLYVSLACPWAHRTLIMRALKGLENVIPISIAHPHMLEHGWEYNGRDGATVDHVNGYAYHWQLYTAARSDYTGRATVPVLWDTHTQTIVNNESAEILRMFNSAFPDLCKTDHDFYPFALRPQIDEINDFVYENINNGVYRCGFATTQDAYEEAYFSLFSALDQIEKRLSQQRYLVGGSLTEADWRLFTTLVRFDAVYVGHFKCNRQRIADYPNLSNYLRELFQVPGVAATVNMDHIKQHYYFSHPTINPSRIVPLGPDLNFTGEHDRQRFPLQD